MTTFEAVLDQALELPTTRSNSIDQLQDSLIEHPVRSMEHGRDTTSDAAAVQTAVYRRMTTDQRTWAAAQMSAMTRAITLGNIRARHPEYDAHQARMALYRLLVGDELFRRAWPTEPLVAP
jgi:hypothetical protein